MKMSKTSAQPVPKPVRWVASSKDDLSAFPNDVKTRVGGALWDAQIGLKSPSAKPLKGFGDAGVLEVVVDFDENTFRTVYSDGLYGANGRLSSFSSERLMRLLTRLGQDVEIVVKSKPRRRQRGRIRVVEEARA